MASKLTLIELIIGASVVAIPITALAALAGIGYGIYRLCIWAAPLIERSVQ